MRQPSATQIEIKHLLSGVRDNYRARGWLLNGPPKQINYYARPLKRLGGTDLGEIVLMRRRKRPAMGDTVFARRRLHPEYDVWDTGDYYLVLWVRDFGEMPLVFLKRVGGMWDER